MGALTYNHSCQVYANKGPLLAGKITGEPLWGDATADDRSVTSNKDPWSHKFSTALWFSLKIESLFKENMAPWFHHVKITIIFPALKIVLKD